jgi:hypothetical protein
MKRLIRIVLLTSILLPGWVAAKFSKHQTVILLESVKEGVNVGSIENLLDSEELAKKVHLIGQAKMTKIAKGRETIVQMVWTGIKDPKDANRQVAFEQPMVSTFKVKDLAKTKGIALSIEGEPESLFTAVKKLEDNHIDKEDIQKKRKAKNPKKKGRFVEGDTKTQSLNSNIDSDQTPPTDPAHVIENDSHHKGLPRNDTALSSSGSLSKTRSGMMNNFQSSDGLIIKDSHPNGSSANQAIGLPHATPLNQNASTSINPQQHQIPHLMDNVNHPNFNNVVAHALPLDEPRQNLTLLEPLHLPFGEAGLNVPNLESAVDPEEPAESAPPRITFEPTDAGCQPRIDRVHERVIIQNRIRRFENNVLVQEGECTDSLEIYPIMKDYLCANCTDIINRDEKRAYSRYQEYWYDRDNQRHVIGDALYTDTSRPYHFMDERGLCTPSMDLAANLAYRQVETVYFNFNNIRNVVEGCHPAPNQTPIPLVQTTERCGLIHDFENRFSYEQKRLIFNLDGVEHEVQSCQVVEPALPHEFVEMECRPIIDLVGGTVTKTARRRIKTSTGFKVITDDCEPWENNSLQTTREGCEGEYFHDFNLMRSYLKKRYFFARKNGQRDYVTGCIRTNDFLQQQTEHDGTYKHDDPERVSKPRLSLYLDTEEQGRIFLDVARVRGRLGQVAYTLLRNEHRATANYYFEGCYRRTKTNSVNVYHRIDGTPYELGLGAGNVIKGTVDECHRTPEDRISGSVLRKGNAWRHTTYRKEYRTKTTYPDGHVAYSGWHF